MHFRVMRILHDECQRIYYAKNRDSSDDSGLDDFEKYLKDDQ